MPSQKNVQLVADIKSDLDRSKSVVLANYSGLDVSAQNELRAKISQAGGQVKILKNRLFKIALADHLGDISPDLAKALNDQTAFLFSFEDAVSAIRALYDFALSHEQLTVKIGLLDGKILTEAEVEALSKLPTRPELIVQLINRLNGPAFGLVNVLTTTSRNLVNVVNAIKKQKAQVSS